MRLLIGVLAITMAAGSAPVQFEAHVLADDLTGGYQVLGCDVNGDGKTDIIGLASGMSDLVWFENPRWERHVLARNLRHMINAACWTQTRGTAPLIAVAHEFSMNAAESIGIVSVLTPGAELTQPWNVKEIDRLPTSHRLRWADIDGTGRRVLVNAPLTDAKARPPEFRGHVPLVYYRPGEWKREIISDAEEGVVHGIFISRPDAAGRDEILIGGFLGIHRYQFDGSHGWRRTEIAQGNPAAWPKGGTSDISVGSLKGKQFLACIEPWHGNEVVVYRKHGRSWRRNVIDATLLQAHTIMTADLDGDGRDEIIAGFRGKPYAVYIYRWESGDQWSRQILEQGAVAASSCLIADLDGDKRPDIACIGSATHNLVWYRNSGE